MTSTFRHQTDGGPSRSIRWQLIFKIDITMKLTHLLTLIKTIISCITSSQIFLCWNMQISSHLIKKKGLVIKAVNRTAAIYLQTLVRLHAPTQAHQLASWFCQSKQRLLSEVAYLLSSGTSVGGLNSRPMSGQQSHTIFRKRPCIAKKKKKKAIFLGLNCSMGELSGSDHEEKLILGKQLSKTYIVKFHSFSMLICINFSNRNEP